MNEIITSGMILSSMPIGEYDRRVEILSSDLGRISAFARGARKPGSSLVSVTRVFASGKFTLYQGRSSYNLAGAQIGNYFEELAADLDKAYYGFYFLELAQYFSAENVESSQMLNLLYFSLRALSLKSLKARLVKCVYELKMLVINGLCPAPDRIFSGTGIYTFAQKTGAGARKAFNYVRESEVEKLFTFTLSDEALADFEDLTSDLIRMNVDRPMKSLSLLD